MFARIIDSMRRGRRFNFVEKSYNSGGLSSVGNPLVDLRAKQGAFDCASQDLAIIQRHGFRKNKHRCKTWECLYEPTRSGYMKMINASA